MQLQYSNLLLITGEVGNVCKCIFLFVECILTLALARMKALRRNRGFDGTASFKNKRCCRSSCTCLRRKIVQHSFTASCDNRIMTTHVPLKVNLFTCSKNINRINKKSLCSMYSFCLSKLSDITISQCANFAKLASVLHDLNCNV